MRKIKAVVVGCLLLLTSACIMGPKMGIISSTPGYLKKVNKVTKVDPKISQALNLFALDLFNEVNSQNGNVFISPVSIYIALGMTYNGADSSTKDEMSQVLNVTDLTIDEFNKLSRNLQSLVLNNDKSDIELANSIWIRDTYQDMVKKDFINRNKDYFGAMMASLDFDNPNTKKVINNWVNKNTKGRVKDAVEEDIHPLTVMFLINTIYFKAEWTSPFAKANTQDGNFYTTDKVVVVPMMNKIDQLGYFEDQYYQGVLLPYNDKQTSMFILLPDVEHTNFTLTNDYLTNVISTMQKNKVSLNLTMPKVKVEYTKSLKEPLSNLGMSHAFSGMADFSKMANRAIEDGLHIQDVTHKSFLAIDEKGTEAAAMTKVEMRLESMPTYDYEMIIDHPFIVGIIDNKSHSIFFLGAIFNPED